MSTLLTALFLPASFGLLFAALYTSAKTRDWRTAFLLAALCDSLFAWALTETLGLFNAIGFAGILSGWMAHDIVLITWLMRRRFQKTEPATDYTDKTLISRINTNAIKQLVNPCNPLKSVKSVVEKGRRFLAENGVAMPLVLGLILSATLVTGIVYPPNNYDSLTYHLPRIEHWIQNGNLSHYFVPNARQLIFAPLSELLMLQTRVLSGGDWLSQSIQWCALLGTLVGISLVCSQLQLGKKARLAACLFFATLPMALLQASTTQNDMVATFYITTLAVCFINWRETPGKHIKSLLFGLALGLAMLSKGTAYPIALPFVVWFAVESLRFYKQRLPGAVFAAAACLIINMPHYVRNQLDGHPFFGGHHGTKVEVSAITPATFLHSVFFNIHSNFPIVLPKKAYESFAKLPDAAFPFRTPLRTGEVSVMPLVDAAKNIVSHVFKGTPLSRNARFYGTPTRLAGHLRIGDDVAPNGLHLLMVAAACCVLLRRKGERAPVFLLLASAFVFVFCIPWQPWITRLQLPLFALATPLVAAAFCRTGMSIVFRFPLVIMCLCAAPILLFNQGHALWPSPEKGWRAGRERAFFIKEAGAFENNYIKAAELVAREKPRKVGLIIGTNIFEYNLWALLRDKLPSLPEIRHQRRDAVEPDCDVLFVLDALKQEWDFQTPTDLFNFHKIEERDRYAAGDIPAGFEVIADFSKHGQRGPIVARRTARQTAR